MPHPPIASLALHRSRKTGKNSVQSHYTAPTKNYLATVVGVADSACVQGVSEASQAVEWRSKVKALHSDTVDRGKRYEAAAVLADLVDKTGSRIALQRLKDAKGYYNASVARSRPTETLFDRKGNVTSERFKKLKETGVGDGRGFGVSLMSKHGGEAENAFKHQGEDLSKRASSPIASPRRSPSPVRDQSTPTKKEMLALAGATDLRIRAMTDETLARFATDDYITSSHNHNGVFRPESKENEAPIPESHSALSGSSMVYAAAVALKETSKSAPSSPRKSRFEKQYALDQKIKAAAKKIMSPTTIRERSKTSEMIDNMKKFVNEIEEEREQKNAWKKGRGFQGRKSALQKTQTEEEEKMRHDAAVLAMVEKLKREKEAQVVGRNPTKKSRMKTSSTPGRSTITDKSRSPSPIRSPLKKLPSVVEQTGDESDETQSKKPNSQTTTPDSSVPASLNNSPTIMRRRTKLHQVSTMRRVNTNVTSSKKIQQPSRALIQFKRRPATKENVKKFAELNDLHKSPTLYTKLLDMPNKSYIPLLNTFVVSSSSDNPSLTYLKLVEENESFQLQKSEVTEDELDDAVSDFVDDYDLSQQAKAGFSGFKAPIALLKTIDADSPKSVHLRAIMTVPELRECALDLLTNSSYSNACIQKYLKSEGGNPVTARTIWSRREVKKRDKSGKGVHTIWKVELSAVLIKSKFPFLSNIISHLDPLVIPKGNVELLEFGSEDYKDTLIGECHAVQKSLQRGFGKGVRLNRFVMDWVLGEDEEDWHILNVISVDGDLVHDRRVQAADRERVPEWIWRDDSGEDEVVWEGSKKECEGDFCGGRAKVWVDNCKTVLGRSILKAKGERFGQVVSAKEFSVAKMNQPHKVCQECYDGYVNLDMTRMQKAREKLEEEEKKAELKEKAKYKKSKGWKSRMQVEYEAKLEEEKEKVRQLMILRKEQQYKILARKRAKSSAVQEQNSEVDGLKFLDDAASSRSSATSDSGDGTSFSSEGTSFIDPSAAIDREARRRAESADVEGGTLTATASIMSKAARIRQATNVFMEAISPQKKSDRMKEKAKQASLRKRKESLADSNSTFSKVLGLLKAGKLQRGRVDSVEEASEDDDSEGVESEVIED